MDGSEYSTKLEIEVAQGLLFLFQQLPLRALSLWTLHPLWRTQRKIVYTTVKETRYNTADRAIF